MKYQRKRKREIFFESQDISTERLFYPIYCWILNYYVLFDLKKKKKYVDIYQSVSKKIDVTFCTFRHTCIYPIIMPDNTDKNIKVKEIERKRQTEIVPITQAGCIASFPDVRTSEHNNERILSLCVIIVRFIFIFFFLR